MLTRFQLMAKHLAALDETDSMALHFRKVIHSLGKTVRLPDVNFLKKIEGKIDTWEMESLNLPFPSPDEPKRDSPPAYGNYGFQGFTWIQNALLIR